jgi:hypothetical protein
MAKQVGPSPFRMKVCSHEGPLDDIADGDRTAKTLPRSPQPKEHPPRRTVGSPLAYIGRKGFTDILRDGEAVLPETLPSDHEFSVLPVYVIEFHMDDFSGAEAEACQKEQDRVIAPVGARGPIAGLKETLDIVRLEGLRQVRQTPICYRGNGSGQIYRDFVLLVEKAQETAKGCGDELDTSPGSFCSHGAE